jgi:hypothetical protein
MPDELDALTGRVGVMFDVLDGKLLSHDSISGRTNAAPEPWDSASGQVDALAGYFSNRAAES